MLSSARPASRARSLSALAVVFALVASTLALTAAPAQAAPAISLTKSAPGSVLAGDTVTYTLTATNPGSDPLFNISFRDVLPNGVRYVAGSTNPPESGEPVPSPPVVNAAGEQTVIWSNVTDLQPGSTATLTFRASVDTALYPVGSSFSNTAGAYGSTDARVIPKFLPNGVPIPNPSVISDAKTAGPTVVTPIKVTKSEGSPEGELMRGVHGARPTTYSLRVENNNGFATTGVTLTDYLPATLEYLGCRTVDNTRINPGTGLPTEEYPTSGSLVGGPPPPNCVLPTSVTTVSNPTVGGTVLAGVYTRLEWALGSLAPNADVDISYAAGAPLRANTTSWALTPGGQPSGASLRQGANLDNNTGASTRETTTEQSATNTARVVGTYTGPLAPGATNPIADQDTQTVRLEDVRVVKGVSPGTFAANQIATFTLSVAVSEYVNASDIVLTDTLPNGYCPLSSGPPDNPDNFVDGDPADCGAIAGTDPTGAAYASVAQQASGEFIIRFTPVAVAANGTATVTFQAKMRETYTGGPLAGTPTTSGDSFTNRVRLDATTTPIVTPPPGTGETGSQAVADDSSATQTTDALTLNKGLQRRVVPQDCADAANNPYLDDADISTPGFDPLTVVFRKGDRVCFELSVDFPNSTAARNVVITDVIPDGTRYEPGSNTVLGGLGSVFNEAAAASGAEFPTWQVGFPTGVGSETYVPAGSTLVIRFSVLVERASDTTVVDKTGNLMKMRSTSSAGQARSYRDEVPFGIAPAPDVPVVKGIAAINGAPVNPPPAPIAPPGTGVDGRQVAEGDVVTFRVDISNRGDDATASGFTIRGLQVWDVLPAGIRCAQISAISAVSTAPGAPVGVCTNPGQGGHPTFAQRATLSAITWTFRNDVAGGDADRIVNGETRSLTYDMAIPTPSGVGTRFDNTAAVRSFEGFTNLFGVTASYFPSANIDTTVDPADYDGPPAQDTSWVFLPQAAFTKELTATGLVEQNNNLVPQAVNGETATYRVRLEIPARTSVFNGRVTDPMNSAVPLQSASAQFFPDAGSATPAPGLPAGVTFTPATGVLQFPNPYTNASDTVQRFDITLVGRVTPTTGAGGKNNTATFSRTPTQAGGTAVTTTAQASATVILPAPTLTKANNAGATVRAGQQITYTLLARNTRGRPPAHDTVVIDCVPAGLAFDSYGTPTQGVTVPPVPGGPGTSCPAQTTQLQWNVGTVLGGLAAPGAADPGESLTYLATVSPAAAAGATYRNNATLTASSLANGANNSAVERILPSTAFNEVTVVTGGNQKTVTPTEATIGQRVTYTVTANVPASVNFYDALLRDRLPAGIDASTVTPESFTCVSVGPCAITGAYLPPVPQADGSALVGWYAGDVLSAPLPRAVRITYSAVVADNPGPSPVRGAQLTNAAETAWFLTPDPNRPQPGVGSGFDRVSTPPAQVALRVLEPKVTVAKAVSDPNPEPGEQFTYTVDIANGVAADLYLSPAFNLEVTDTVPNGVVVIGPVLGGTFTPDATPADGGGTITWQIAQLDPYDTAQRAYSARLADSTLLSGGPLVNTVAATSYRSLDGDGRTYSCPACSKASATVAPAFPKLTLVKTAVGGEPTYIEEAYPWRITVTNTGQGKAVAVSVADALPPNWRYVPGTSLITRPSGTLPQAPSGAVIGGDNVVRLTWDALADLLPGQSLTVDFQARPGNDVVDDPRVGSAQRHVNNAQATAVDAAGFPGFGSPLTPYAASGSASTRIDAADLAITKTHALPEPAAGAPFAWQLSVRNASGDLAVGRFVVSDQLPAGSIPNGTPSGPGWSCTAPDATLAFTCQRTNPADTLAAGAPAWLITVPVRTDPSAPVGTKLTNSAMVEARTYDPNGDNNEATDTVTLQAAADLQVIKKLSGAVVAGQDATYTLDVANLGPSTARAGVTVVDTLPAGSVVQSVTGGTDWACPHTPGAPAASVTCTYLPDGGDVVPGATDQITVVVRIPAAQTTAVTNTAVVASAVTPDLVPGNNTSTVSTTPATEADLQITKSSTNVFIAGQQGTYLLTVDNLGSSDAQNVEITDTLPTGLAYAGFSPDPGPWTCGAVGPLFTCRLAGPLAADTSSSVEVAVAIDPNPTLTNPAVNTAVVSSTTKDPDGGNNSSTDSTDSQAFADLFIVKTDAPDPVRAGEQITYTLQVGNNGPSDAAGPIVVTDALPPGTSFASSSVGAGSAWTCDETAPGSGTVECTRATVLAAGDDGLGDLIEIVVDVDPSTGPTTLRNTARVDSLTTPEPPNAGANNSDSAETRVIDEAELVLTKATTGTDPVVAGDPAGTEFTLTVENEGPSTADQVVVTDTMPAGLVPVSAAGSGPDAGQWSCLPPAGQLITCSRAALRPGTSTIVVKAVVDASVLAPTTFTNSATVETATNGDNQANNTAKAPVEVVAEADLAITKSHPAGAYRAGDPITFTLGVTNNGFSDAQPVLTIDDTLPTGFTYLSSSSPWACAAQTPTPTGQDVQCTLPGASALPAGAAAPPLVMQVRIGAELDPGTYANVARVSSGTPEPVDGVGPNEARDPVVVSAEADLSITKTHAGPVRIGDELTFELTVFNDGPSEARDVEVVDTLPAGLIYQSATVVTPSGSCVLAPGGSEIACTLDDPLPPKATAQIEILVTVEVAAHPSVVNPATVGSSTPENPANLANNSTTDLVEVPDQVDLSITKSHTGSFVVGQEGAYALVVSNAGPTADRGPVTVTDVLPAGLTYVSGTGDGWVCEATGPSVECERAAGLLVDEDSTITLRVAVGPQAAPGVVNSADVASRAEDIDPSNNSAKDPTEVIPLSVLTLSKDLASVQGTRATYVLTVTNTGPNATTTPITLTDPLPPQLTYVSATGPGWECASAAPTVTCTYAGVLQVGQPAAVTLAVDVKASGGEQILNVATVQGGSPTGTAVSDDALLSVPPGGLANTGAALARVVYLGLILLLLGAAALRIARPRGRPRSGDSADTAFGAG